MSSRMPLCLAFQKSALQKAMALASAKAVHCAQAVGRRVPLHTARAEQVDLAEGMQPSQLAAGSD